MRKLLALTLVAGLVALGGCNKPATTGGSKPVTKVVPGGGSTGSTGTPAVEPKGSVAVGDVKDVEVEKEKDADATIKVARTDYAGEIKVTFDTKGAEGVSVDPDSVTIAEGKDEATVKIKAGKDAKGGEIKVTATPKDEKVKPATGKIAVKVK